MLSCGQLAVASILSDDGRVMHSPSTQDYTDLEIRIDPLRGDAYPVTLVVDGARQYQARKGKVCECASLPV